MSSERNLPITISMKVLGIGTLLEAEFTSNQEYGYLNCKQIKLDVKCVINLGIGVQGARMSACGEGVLFSFPDS